MHDFDFMAIKEKLGINVGSSTQDDVEKRALISLIEEFDDLVDFVMIVVDDKSINGSESSEILDVELFVV